MHSTTQSASAHAPLKRFWGTFAVGLALGCGMTASLHAATLQAPPITVDGSRVSVPALERNKQVFVPVRGVFEKLGATVTYTEPASIVASKNGKALAHLIVGSRTAMINGVSQHLAAAPFPAQGHVMVPLRLISEAAGANVAYVPSPRSVNITHRTVVAAAAVAPLVAADPVASAAPVAQEEHRGFPWWVWPLAALVTLGIILALMRRKKEPTIVTTSKGRGNDPYITTRR